MPTPTLKPSSFAIELARQLSTSTRHVVLFIAPGASRSFGLSDANMWKKHVFQNIDAEQCVRFEAQDLESRLPKLRRLIPIVKGGL